MRGRTEPAHPRLALLIATSDYGDPAFEQLRTPGRDAGALAEVLGNPQLGRFAVRTLTNARFEELLEEIEELCAGLLPDDQLLVYLSCHGLIDNRGRLYFAASDTRRARVATTAVSAAWLNEQLDDCRARSQIVILDCCYSAAFTAGAKGQPAIAVEHHLAPQGGNGRVILTASSDAEYSFEGDRLTRDGILSVFTKAIVDGLRTGDADRDKDGLITVTEVYDYAYDRVRAVQPRQRPRLWAYGAMEDALLAYSVRGAEPVPLPQARQEDQQTTPQKTERFIDYFEFAGLDPDRAREENYGWLQRTHNNLRAKKSSQAREDWEVLSVALEIFDSPEKYDKYREQWEQLQSTGRDADPQGPPSDPGHQLDPRSALEELRKPRGQQPSSDPASGELRDRIMPGSTPTARGRIFISYRRDDTAWTAGWLFDRLAGQLGEGQVFKDVDSIELGDDFVEVITTAVGSCDVLLALIGHGWLTITDEEGRRRLDNPEDFVRLEIEAALTRNVRVIPILIEGARMPRADQLPASLAKMVRRQALRLSPDRFKSDTGQLLKALDRILALPPGYDADT